MLKPRGVKVLLLVVFASLALIGCQQGGDGNGTTDGTPIDQTVRLQWWGVFWDEEVVSSLISEYESQNPNVEIVYQNKWPGGDHNIAAGVYKANLERVLFSNDQDQIPDIFMVQNTWAGNYDELYTQPAPISTIDAATVQQAFYPAVSTDFVTNNQVNGLPLWMDTFAILYNKDMLEEEAESMPPADWVSFRELVKDLTKSGGTQYGFAAGTGQNVSFAAELFYILFFQNGIEMRNAGGSVSFATNQDAQNTLNFYRQFAIASSVGGWNASQDNDALAFLTEKVAMIVAPLWRYNDIVYFNDRYNLGLDIGIAPMPQNATNETINFASYWGAMVAKNRPEANRNTAWQFITWLTEKEQLRKLRVNDLERDIRPEGFLYPRSDMQSELRQLAPQLSAYVNALPNARSWYMVDGFAVESVIRELIDSGGQGSDLAAAQNDIQNIIANKGLLLRN